MSDHELCGCGGEECIACRLGRLLAKVAADLHRTGEENHLMRRRLNIMADADVTEALRQLGTVPMRLHAQLDAGEWLPVAEGRIEDGRLVHAVVELPDGHMGEGCEQKGAGIAAAFFPAARGG
jgi:hypothetical protein